MFSDAQYTLGMTTPMDIPSKHAQQACWIQFRRVLVVPVMAIMANIQPELAGLYTCQIYLPTSDSVSFFQRRPRSYCQKLTRIQSGWPGQALAKQIWSGSKTVCQNHQACFWQNATSLIPVSHFQTQLRSSAVGQNDESYCANQSSIWFWLIPVWFWLTIPGLGRISPVYLVLADHSRFGQDQSSLFGSG